MTEYIKIDDMPDGEWTWRLVGDLQLGAAGVDLDLIPKILEPVRKKKHCYMSILGDSFDRIGVKDKRFSFEDFDHKLAEYRRKLGPRGKMNVTGDANRALNTLDGAVEYLHDKLNPVADKVLSLNIGNHELVNKEEYDPIRRICLDLDIPYGGYSALVQINETFHSQLWHGRPSLNSNVIDSLQRNLNVKRSLVRTSNAALRDQRVSLIAQGHVNQLIVVRPEESAEIEMSYDWNTGKERATLKNKHPRWYVCAGSIQRATAPGRTTYVEARAFRPLPIGCVDVLVKNNVIQDVRPVYLD